MLCATIKNENLAAIHQANQEADLIELSLQPQNLANLRPLCKKPVIFKLKEVDSDLLKLNPEYIDLPHTTSSHIFEKIKERFPNIKRICSYHDFEKTGDLEAIFSKLRMKPAEIYKIATMAQSSLDALNMLKFVKNNPLIGICMGEMGTITRILAPLFNVPWTYAPCSEDQSTAPGQLLLKDLLNIYNFKELSTSTAIYGLIGDPVSQSHSHLMHNFAFKKLGLDAVYVKMRVTKEELCAFFSLCQELKIRGLSVTMPLKEAITPYIQGCKDKAINTLRFDQKKIHGWNTDGSGALNALEKRGKVKGKTIVLIGAGGAAWGIGIEAKKRGANLVILNRSPAKAEELAKEVGGLAFPLEKFAEVAKRGYDILINCTSLGMGEDKRLVVPEQELLEKRLVMDIISNPRNTPLLMAAKRRRCKTIEGIEMWMQQATYQYCHWFDVK